MAELSSGNEVPEGAKIIHVRGSVLSGQEIGRVIQQSAKQHAIRNGRRAKGWRRAVTTVLRWIRY